MYKGKLCHFYRLLIIQTRRNFMSIYIFVHGSVTKVAGRVVYNPFHHADIVTTTTHKSLRGPRSGMIFARREYMESIDSAVFPMLQGGPHNNNVGALAVALKEASSSGFLDYAKSVVSNSKALASGLEKRGHTIATGGTDNHLILWDVRSLGLTGSKADMVLERASITANKNSLPGDKSAINPGGVRLGTPALTTRGLDENDFDQVADFLHRGSEIAIQAQLIVQRNLANQLKSGVMTKKTNTILLEEFQCILDTDNNAMNEIEKLRHDVESFATPFFLPG